MERFSDIKTKEDLASFLGVPLNTITKIIYIDKVDQYYDSFDIPKKNGDKRNISAPTGTLKIIQSRLSKKLWEHVELIRQEKNISPNISHAFEKRKSIITNAQIHRNKRYIVNLDLKNFFDTIHIGRICGYFEKNKDFLLPHEVAVTIAQLVCYKGRLPQGSPCSPIIANLICQIMDMRLLHVAKGYKLDYTRYADDLTFSTNNKNFENSKERFFKSLEREIKKCGFCINEKKTRIVYKDSRQEVTGLTVNKKISVNTSYVKETRAMAHSLYTKGLFYIDGKEGTLNQLEGRFSFIDQIELYNNRIDGKIHNSRNLSGREKQYRQFLFYKEFYANDIPLIITEGKTDILYIKAALQKYYELYPTLIKKENDGTFTFKLHFFNRTKIKTYLFGFSSDGADSIKYIYNYFLGLDGRANYLKYFKENSHRGTVTPIIFLFDNEINIKNKPINKFLSYIKASNEDINIIKERLYLKLLDDYNLYLMTNPIINGEKESEIEDLLPKEVLEITLKGKTFKRDMKKGDDIKHFGKDILSKYVLNHYNEIDFKNFKTLLDTINTISEGKINNEA